MEVRIVVDDYGLYSGGAKEDSSPDVGRIHSVRDEIRHYLTSQQGGEVAYRMASDIYKRFSDLEGQRGLTVEYFTPHHLLRKRLGCKVPSWLTPNIAQDINLFTEPFTAIANGDDVVTRLLSLIAPSLVSESSLPAFVKELSESTLVLDKLLQIDEVSSWLTDKLSELGLDKGATELLQLFREHKAEGYLVLAKSSLRDHLDSLVLQYRLHVDFVLPARRCSAELVKYFDMLPLEESVADSYPEFIEHLLSIVERHIASQELAVESLAEFVIQDWESIFTKLEYLFNINPNIVSEPLINSLQSKASPKAQNLAAIMLSYLDSVQCEILQNDSSVKNVLQWSDRYFSHAIGAFERGEEPNSETCNSFSRWLVYGKNRVTQSEYDWRVASDAVEKELESGNVVILCIVDALGAIHNDIVESILAEELHTGTHWALKSLFAPLPTITKVGKVAVMTGEDVLFQGRDYEVALRNRFKRFLPENGSLQLVKNWIDFRVNINSKTRLLVCLDNRIDDDLHQCVDFIQHRERVRSVTRQLVRAISKWQLDATRFGNSVVTFISADHGATNISHRERPLEGKELVEGRIFKAAEQPTPAVTGFHFEQAERSGAGYLIPIERVRFDTVSTMLHGGLSPEEVLIPFVRISKEVTESSDQLNLIAEDAFCQPVTNGWYVTLSLENTIDTNFFNIRIRTKSPFTSECPIIDRLDPYEDRKSIIFRISSDVEQVGMTEVSFDVYYQRSFDAPLENIECILNLQLGRHLIELGQESQDFENSFE